MKCFQFSKTRLISLLLSLYCMLTSIEESTLHASNGHSQARAPKVQRTKANRAQLKDKIHGRLIRVDFTEYKGKNQQAETEVLANPNNLSVGDSAFNHAIRIQAQGGGLEKSVTIQKNQPISRREVRLAMSALAKRLTPDERKTYRGAFVQASKKVTSIAQNRGIGAADQGIQGLNPRNNRTKPVPGNEVRVDVNFLRGHNLDR